MNYIEQIKAHAEAYVQGAEQSVADHVHAFLAWVEGKNAEEAQAAEYTAWLQAHGYTVTKP